MTAFRTVYTSEYKLNFETYPSRTVKWGMEARRDRVHENILKARREREEHEMGLIAGIPEEAGEGYFQALDEVIRQAQKANIVVEDAYHTHIREQGVHLYYEKFILKRLQTPKDDWAALPEYKGWKIDSNSREDDAVPLLGIDGNPNPEEIRVPILDRRIPDKIYETFMVLYQDRQPQQNEIEDLLRTAELLEA